MVNDNEEQTKYRHKLGLTIEEFAALQSQAEKWFNLDQYGWTEMFLDLNLAREFAASYLSHTRYTDTGAETVLWLPWAIIELDLAKQN